MTREIKLTKGQVALVDDDNYEEISKLKWQALWSSGTQSFYAVQKVRKDGKWISEQMHSVIVDTPNGMFTDHINHNTLDNRKENLRVCTPSQNQSNRGKQKNNTSGYKGVRKSKSGKKWIAQIRYLHKSTHLGYWNTPEDAARAYDSAAIRLHGEYAVLNFPLREDKSGLCPNNE